MDLPPLGLYAPGILQNVRDGDTIVMRMRTGQDVAIRLLDVNCVESGQVGFWECKRQVINKLRSAKRLHYYLQAPPVKENTPEKVDEWFLDVNDMLKTATWDRWPGRVWADGEDLSSWLIQNNLGAPYRVR